MKKRIKWEFVLKNKKCQYIDMSKRSLVIDEVYDIISEWRARYSKKYLQLQLTHMGIRNIIYLIGFRKETDKEAQSRIKKEKKREEKQKKYKKEYQLYKKLKKKFKYEDDIIN